MTMFRVCKNKDNPYVTIHKGLAQDPALSAKEKGIMFYALSLPDDWQFYETELVRHFRDGLDSIRTGIKVLIEKRYMHRVKRRSQGGKFMGYEYWIFETPQDPEYIAQLTVMGKSNNGKSNTTNNDITKDEKFNSDKVIRMPGMTRYEWDKPYRDEYNQAQEIG